MSEIVDNNSKENLPPEETEGRRPYVDEGGKFSSLEKISTPEVIPSKKRRNFTSSYKLKILDLADKCKGDSNSTIGSLLRSEGLYSSHLVKWRQQRKKGELNGLAKQRGVKTKDLSLVNADNKRLQRENEKLKKKLETAQIIIDFQKKTSAILKMIDQQEEKK